jgi:hypothetical protein
MKTTLIVSTLGLLTLAALPASSQAVTPLLSGTAGTGSAESFLVLDFEDGLVNDNYAFGYFYDPNAATPVTGYDMVEGLANANLGLTAPTTDYSFGEAIDNFSYNGQSMGGFQSNGYWSYYLSSDGENWQSSGVGMSDRDLTNGSYDGWAWDAGTDPLPVTPLAGSAVPEAGAGWLCLAAALPLLWIARRRKQA